MIWNNVGKYFYSSKKCREVKSKTLKLHFQSGQFCYVIIFFYMYKVQTVTFTNKFDMRYDKSTWASPIMYQHHVFGKSVKKP